MKRRETLINVELNVEKKTKNSQPEWWFHVLQHVAWQTANIAAKVSLAQRMRWREEWGSKQTQRAESVSVQYTH